MWRQETRHRSSLGTAPAWSSSKIAWDSAMAWFPFDQGWIGGYFANATVSPASWYRHATYGPALGKLTTAKDSADAILKWDDLPDGSKGGLATLALFAELLLLWRRGPLP